MLRPVSTLLILAAAFGGAREAHAYKCTAVANKVLTQAWNQRCIPYYIDRRGTLFTGEDKRNLIAQSFRVWSGNPCTDLEFLDAGYTDAGPGFDPRKPSDQINVVVSIEEEKDLAAFPQDGLLAITLTSYSTETGEILDADILMNAVDFMFAEVEDQTSCRLGRMAFDLRNTLVHEMGHFIGFDHVTAEDSTMYASAEQCEVKKRDITDDDRLGVCTVYPKGQPTATCAPPAGGYEISDASAFHCQCVRVTGITTEECRDKGCSCVAAPAAEAGGTPWTTFGGLAFAGVALAASLATLSRRRRARAA